MSEKEKWYVYILTNPSFREDWVKIWKSSRPVDVRSKELDNTAIPLPFEIHATLQTSKYNIVERKLHKIFTDLADARIRKSREFFNITPEKAYEYLKLEAEILDDWVLNGPDDDIAIINNNWKRKSNYKWKYLIKTDEIFYFYKDTTDAKMRVINGNKYILLEWSKIDQNFYSNIENIKKLRSEFKDKLKENITISDIEFSSPSTAWQFVSWGSVNWKYYWRTKDDKKLDEFVEYI